MGRCADVLEWLLPEAGPDEGEHARRLITFVRLMHHDARGRPADAVGLALPGAREEMERVGRTSVLLLLEELLRFHLEAGLPRDSWSDFGPAGIDLQTAWSRLETWRAVAPGLPAVPRPGEEILPVAERILEAAQRLGADPAWIASWRARWSRVAHGPAAGERAWREVLARAKEERWSLGVAAQALAGVAHALLDRGAVREAHGLLSENLVLASVDDELAWLHAWTALVLGEPELAEELVRGRGPRLGRLPLALAELRERQPAWSRYLAGRAPAEGLPPSPGRIASRRALFAAVFGVFALADERSLHALVFDAAPGAREHAQATLERREGAWSRPGEPEHRVLVDAVPVLRHAADGRPPRGALAGTTSRALALVPVLDPEGEAVGWIHVELEHHLLPSRARLEALARAWQADVCAARTPEITVVPEPAPPAPLRDPADPRRAWAERVLPLLGTKTARRRVFVLDVEPDPAELVLEAGGALADWRAAPGGRRALRRARRTASAVAFDAGDGSLGMHARAGSGVVVPLVLSGRVHGLFVIESSRARDFRPADLARIRAALEEEALAWRAAQFRRWHATRFDADLFLDPGARAWRDGWRDLFALARSRSPVAVVGPEGSGKEVLARWLHFEGSTPQAPIVVRRAGEALEGLPDRGTLVLDDLDCRGKAEQVALVRALGVLGRRAELRTIALSRTPLRQALACDALRGDLAARFERLELFVPPLRDRRDEIPGLIDVLASEIARREAAARAGFTDEAIALLWRQPWAGNVRELEAFLHRAVLDGAGTEIDAPRLLELARRCRRPLRPRMPSRRPRRADLEAALETTAHARGSWNKTRAALYLGWDPDTLVARLADTPVPPGRSLRGGS